MTLPTMEQASPSGCAGRWQGVGFRPFGLGGWRRAAGLRGEVLNDAEGVLIRLVAQDCGDFIAALRADSRLWPESTRSRPCHRFLPRCPRGFPSWPARAQAPKRGSRPMPRPARNAGLRSLRPVGGRAMPLPTAPIAGRAIRSCANCPMTGREPRWRALIFAPIVPPNMPIPPTVAFTRNPSPARPAAQTCGMRPGEKRSRAIRSHWRWRR